MEDKKIDEDIEYLSVNRHTEGRWDLAIRVVERGTLTQFKKYLELWQLRKFQLYHIVRYRDDICHYIVGFVPDYVASCWEYDCTLTRILSCRGMKFSSNQMFAVNCSLDRQLQEIEPLFPFFTFGEVIRGYLDYLEY